MDPMTIAAIAKVALPLIEKMMPMLQNLLGEAGPKLPGLDGFLSEKGSPLGGLLG